MTSMCCYDAYHVTPRISTMTGFISTSGYSISEDLEEELIEEEPLEKLKKEDLLLWILSKEDHKVHLKLVLELLKEEKLFAKFFKCEFWIEEVHFLGHVVNNNDIHVDSSKIEAMKNWKVPKTPAEI
ncbi:hypothetical protein Tco_1311097 [Tanacetum coccineum]